MQQGERSAVNLSGMTFRAVSNSKNGSLNTEAGTAHARFELDDQERMRMILEWRWLTGDGSAGRSEWIQT
jgi:hypothetical protein